MALVELFVEDAGHSAFLTALLRRLSAEQNVSVRVRERSARGGHGRVMEELDLVQQVPGARPDVLVVAVDANCQGWDDVRKEVTRHLDPTYCPRQVVACPDPHVERWYLADPASLRDVLGVVAQPPAQKCERAFYKRLLSQVLSDGGYGVTLGGVEFANEIVDAMDLFRGGKNDASLKHCIDDLRAALKGLTS